VAAGSVKRNPKTGTWYGRFDAPRNPDGTRQQIRIYAATEGQCWDKLHKRASEVKSGAAPTRDTERMTVSELLDLWLETKQAKAFRTRDSYESVVRLHLRPTLGHLRVRDVRRSDIERAIVAWTTGPRKDGKAGQRGNTAVRQCITYVYMAFGLAKADGLRLDNPVDGVHRPGRVRPENPFVTADGAISILKAIVNTSVHAPLFIAFVSGLRPGELLALRRRDVILDSRTIQVRGTIEYRGKYIARRPSLKTQKSRRDIPFAEATFEVLTRALHSQADRLRELGLAATPDTLLFDSGFGDIWHPDEFRKQLRKLLRAAGISFQWRATRHSFASICVEESVHTKVTAEILGHEDDRLTSTIYQGVRRNAEMVEASRRVTEQLSVAAPVDARIRASA
jgi:integrase